MTTPQAPSAQSTPLRFAITGLGSWAWRHIKLIEETPGFELCGVCTRSATATADASQKLPGIPFFTTQAALFAALKPDVVVITTPHHTHAAFAIEALAAGVHVVVEKPISTTLADARAMLEAAQKASRTLAVYHNRHWDPWLLAAKSALTSGRLGELLQVDSTWPYYFSPDSWRGLKAQSGGQFFDVGAHLADWLLQLADSTPEFVSGQLRRLPGSDPAHNEDHAVAFIRFKNGITSQLCCTAMDSAPTRRFHLIGSTASYVDAWNWGGGHAQLWTGRPGGPVAPSCEELPYGHEDETGGGRPLYKNLADHFLRGAPLEVPPTHALIVLGILLAAQESAAQGGAWIPFDEFMRRA